MAERGGSVARVVVGDDVEVGADVARETELAELLDAVPKLRAALAACLEHSGGAFF